VPFVRVSRDKRGYEHIYLFEVSNRRPSKPRILYWFRTPPGVRVGREPFDEPVKRALEALNPGVMFDWKKLASDTLPTPIVENWRERRRVEREAKRAKREDEERTAAGDEPPADDEPAGEAMASEASAGEMAGDNLPNDEVAAAEGSSVPSQKPMAVSGAGEAGPVARHRRRRRGGRHRRSSHGPDLSGAPQLGSPGRSISSTLEIPTTATSATAISERARSEPAVSETAISDTDKMGADPLEEK
jgi:hypothetical protein